MLGRSSSTLVLVWIVPLLALSAAPGEGLKPPTPDTLRADTTRSDTIRPVADSARRPQVPKPIPVVQPYHAPAWSWELAPRAGVLAVDFPQKVLFASDLSQTVSSETLLLRQPFPGSDLAWSVGMDGVVRRLDIFRIVAGVEWSAWSAQAIAGKLDSLVQAAGGRDSLTYRSYSSDVWTGEIGFDLLIPRKILSVDASHDAFLGFRYRQGIGRLVGRTTAWGWSFGESFLLGADVLSWKRWALTGVLGWNSTSSQSNRTWSDVLWASASPDQVTWNGGGLSLQFQLRWGPDRDTSAVGAVQKK